MATTATQLTNTTPHWKLPISRTPTISTTTSIAAATAKSVLPATRLPLNNSGPEVQTFSQIRRKLDESRKIFLDEQKQPAEDKKDQLHVAELADRLKVISITKRAPIEETNQKRKKISFKIRKTSSIYRRKEPKAINLVQELTKKYNELDEQRRQIPAANSDKSLAKLIKRVNSQNLRRRPSHKEFQKRLTTQDEKLHSVQAAIAIFEQKCNVCTSNAKEKPKIPEKTFDIHAIAVRNQEKRMRLRQKLHCNANEADSVQRNNTIVNLCNESTLANNHSVNNSGNDTNNDVKDTCSDGKDVHNDNQLKNTSSSQRADVDDRLVEGDIKSEKSFKSKMECNTEVDDSGGGLQENEVLQIVSLPMSALKKCESNYECQKFGRYSSTKTIYGSRTLKNSMDKLSITSTDSINQNHSEQVIVNGHKNEEVSHDKVVEKHSEVKKQDSLDEYYDIVLPPENDQSVDDTPKLDTKDKSDTVPPLPPRSGKLTKIYASLKATLQSQSVQKPSNQSVEDEDDYEIPQVPDESTENIYESLSRCSHQSSKKRADCRLIKKQTQPLPPRPSSSSSSTQSNDDYNNESNYYESIYSKREDNYESIYGGSAILLPDVGCKRNSISVQSVQSDHQTNSIYGRSITSWAEEVMDTYIGGGSTISTGSGGSPGGSQSHSGGSKAASELSGSSDDWVDISDHENVEEECHRTKCNKCVVMRQPRHQKGNKKLLKWSQQMRDQWNKVPNKLQQQQGDTDSDHHYEILYSSSAPIPQLHHATNDDDDDDFDSFDSDCESDNSFAKNDSGVDMGNTQLPEPPSNQTYAFTRFAASAGKNVMKRLRRNWSMRKNDFSKSLSRITKRKSRTDLDTIDNEATLQADKVVEDKQKTRGFLNKFKRSMSMTGDFGDNFADRPKSTFYLTEAISVDDDQQVEPANRIVDDEKEKPLTNNKNSVYGKPKPNLVRPQMPPPPTPTTKSRSQSWYSECGLFKPDPQAPALPRRPNSFWYAEVGLYQSGSPPSTASSSEISGNSSTGQQKDENSDDYYNKNYYNDSVKSYDSNDTKKDEAFNSLQGDIQLRLQDEPLYQFYDAAVLDSVCQNSLSDFSDDYEEVEKEKRSSRPTAMELVSPQRNNVSVARTLWCEIPEVVQSTVLSTLSIHQKKLQEAKFEMLTSEASYLNSLNVLTNHFVRQLSESELLNEDDKLILCGKILPVKECSEKLLLDLEKCWQDNILLHGVCDIVKRHAEESFNVYVSYCENQIILDQTLKRLKEKPLFAEFLRQLEANSVCQLLTLYSFLMLPMQRITRWPLLVDAILKRLSPQDDEYLSCQYALATLNKIVNQCNEGARKMERVTEMKKIAAQMEFAKGVPPMEVANGQRWLVRSGMLTQMINRGDDVKLTFGKRFTKIPVHLFLFNDIFIVAKNKGEGLFIVQHYCSRSFLELNGESLAMLPTKDTQGRHLIFLTILENHDEKTVEMLLSCSSESDKERWLEALTPPKSENPDETLYECWDCPQVTAVHNYTANQPDELPLARGDIINVTRKMADGWYHGERIRDGETGWFPANYTVEVANPHVRARNLKQRYRLLAFSENYLKSK